MGISSRILDVAPAIWAEKSPCPLEADSGIHRLDGGPYTPRTGKWPSCNTFQHLTFVGAIGVVSWIGLAIGAMVGAVLSATNGGQIPRTTVLTCAAIFLLSVLLRLVIATIRVEGRRLSLGALTAAIALWIASAATVKDTAAPLSFPAPGELLLHASYVGFTAFIVRDAAHRRRTLGCG